MHTMKKLAVFLRLGLLALLLAGACIRPANAASAACNVWVSGTLGFGTINLLAGGVTDSVATVSYGCNGTPGTVVLLCIGMAADPDTQLYTLRNLKSGNDRMAFNLYTDAARSTIWGDINAGGSYPPLPVAIVFGPNDYYKPGTTTVYGRIQSAGQTGLPAGTYGATWQMTTASKTVTSPASSDCTGERGSGGTLTIQAKVNSDCRIDSASTMDFGTVFQTLNQNVDSTSTITVTCNGGQGANGYKVGLGNGLNPSGQQRRMKGPNGGYINYELYRDAQRSNRWGNDYNSSLPGVGNGLPQALTVYGRVPSQTAPGAGLYSDTITVTISY